MIRDLHSFIFHPEYYTQIKEVYFHDPQMGLQLLKEVMEFGVTGRYDNGDENINKLIDSIKEKIKKERQKYLEKSHYKPKAPTITYYFEQEPNENGLILNDFKYIKHKPKEHNKKALTIENLLEKKYPELKESGVYAFYCNDICLYIGSTSRFSIRIVNHVSSMFDYNIQQIYKILRHLLHKNYTIEVKILKILDTEEEYREEEGNLIHEMQPLLNSIYPNTQKYKANSKKITYTPEEIEEIIKNNSI